MNPPPPTCIMCPLVFIEYKSPKQNNRHASLNDIEEKSDYCQAVKIHITNTIGFFFKLCIYLVMLTGVYVIPVHVHTVRNNSRPSQIIELFDRQPNINYTFKFGQS